MMMNIRERLVKEENSNLKLFDYYKSIGCTDNQSLVLSLYTYGRNSYWYNDLKAFSFYLDLYKKNKEEVSFCDYIAERILSVENVPSNKALENAKEYVEYMEEIRKNHPATLDSFDNFEGAYSRTGLRSKKSFGGLFSKSVSAVNNFVPFKH